MTCAAVTATTTATTMTTMNECMKKRGQARVGKLGKPAFLFAQSLSGFKMKIEFFKIASLTEGISMAVVLFVVEGGGGQDKMHMFASKRIIFEN